MSHPNERIYNIERSVSGPHMGATLYELTRDGLQEIRLEVLRLRSEVQELKELVAHMRPGDQVKE